VRQVKIQKPDRTQPPLTAKEKRLFTIMLVIFLGYMLPFVILPAGWGLIENYRDDIARLKTDLERYQQLGAAAQVWEEAHEKAARNKAQVESGLLQGNTRDLVAARLQSLLRNLAREHQLTVQSMAVPEFNTNEYWMLVTQSLQLNTEGGNLIPFLNALEAAPEKLVIVSMEVRANRGNQLNVEMKITGFSRLDNLNTEVIPVES
jgi:hypothetical protein